MNSITNAGQKFGWVSERFKELLAGTLAALFLTGTIGFETAAIAFLFLIYMAVVEIFDVIESRPD